MVSLAWSVDRTDGVTFVALRVESDGPARRVRVENRLAGPVWPPRSQGRPVEGWDDGGFAGVVAAGSTLSLGYASPADPVDPPAELVAVDPPDDDGSSGLDPASPAGVVRSLGSPVVPREAVPVPAGGPDPTTHAGPGTGPTDRAEDRSTDPAGGPSTDRAEDRSTDETAPEHDATEPLLARLSAIERRLAALEGGDRGGGGG